MDLDNAAYATPEYVRFRDENELMIRKLSRGPYVEVSEARRMIESSSQLLANDIPQVQRHYVRIARRFWKSYERFLVTEAISARPAAERLDMLLETSTENSARAKQRFSPRQSRRNQLFSPRQLEVLELVRQGKPNKIIAYELNMQESTVKIHVRAIMKKLKVTNRTEAGIHAAHLLDELKPNFRTLGSAGMRGARARTVRRERSKA